MVFITLLFTRRKVFLCLVHHSHARASMTSRLSGLYENLKQTLKFMESKVKKKI